KVGTIITNADERIIFISESCITFEALNQNKAHGQQWEDALPFDINEKKQLRLMMMKPAAQQKPVSLTWQNQAGQHYWLECDIRDDPREIGQHIFYFYDNSEVYHLRNQLSQNHYGQMLGNSEAMLQMYETFERIAQGFWPVMIEGETGVGKELVARGLHAASARHSGPFIAVNCGSLSESLLASQLFGHRKGAFTGAIADQSGFFEAAAGGTLFLDEIAELSLNMQSSLLRVLQENEITKLGDAKVRKVDVRILTATHKNLEKEVNDGRFRADLFYRIRVARIRVPPLRERLDDIPLLVASFLTQAQASIDKVINQISMEAMRCLQSYHWPGNVRELKNAIEHAIIHSRQGIIRPDALPPEILESINHKSKTEPPYETIEFEGDEETRLLKALEKANGNRSRAARLLKMSRSHFYRRLKACGISFRK
ncbi:MAG: sigma 54-interacting transcriptional regulator, partial [Candidatus Parabeggiatoa sp.]|nr:sigma 54-interacting transcriptional regulator [Candidatus Parabeggiatoa sp.]